MSFFKRNKKEFSVIFFFTCIKLVLHFFANNNFGIHRDEFLYLALGEHLDWGFKEVPPFVAAVAWFTSNIFGSSVFAIRIFSTLAGALIVYLTGLTVLAMGGKRLQISIACLAVLVSPAFLASGYLLQPVVFDQLFWTLTAYLIIRYVKTGQNIFIYSIGMSVGFGMLNKYTMAFYTLALIFALALTPQRKILFNKSFLLAAVIALGIFLPNLIWQFTNGLPIFNHMKELQETQLNFINPLDFVIQQLLLHASASLIWLSGIIFLFFSRSLKPYRFLAFAYLLVILILIVMHGKSYYSFGAYPVLFAAGGIAFGKLLAYIKTGYRFAALTFILLPCLFFIPIAIPILPFNTTLSFFKYSADKLNINFFLKWEDQKFHAITQDYADMLGWEELAIGVAKVYQLLPVPERIETTIFASNYSQAGAIDHFRHKYNLPPSVSLSSSFALWSPDSIKTKYFIYIDDEYPDDLIPMFKNFKKIGEVKNFYAREKGTSVYLLSHPIKNLQPVYQKHREERFD